MNETEASQLWDELRNALGNFERVLAQIIQTRAWEPLGYASLSEAWQDRMAGTRLSTAVAQAYLVYELLDEGQTPDQIVQTVGVGTGLGPERVEVLARQWRNGVPPTLATNFVRRSQDNLVVGPFIRKAENDPASVIHVQLTPDEYDQFKAVAKRRGLDLIDEATKAVRAHFAKLERR